MNEHEQHNNKTDKIMKKRNDKDWEKENGKKSNGKLCVRKQKFARLNRV